MGKTDSALPFLCSDRLLLRRSFAITAQFPPQSIAHGDPSGRRLAMFGDKLNRKRRSLARSLERASVPERPYIGRGPRYLVHPEIAVACAPSLRALAAALRDESVAFDDSELRAIRSFITDGVGSAFFGRDATAALREAVGLQHAVLGPLANDHNRDQHIAENEDTLSTRTISVITATVVAALLFAVPALGNNGGGNASSSGNPRLFKLLLEKNGVVDYSIVGPQVSTYRNAIRPAVAEHDLGRYVKANQHGGRVPTGVRVAATTSESDVNWSQIAIGVGIGLALVFSLMLTYRATRRNRPLAH